MQRAGCNGPGTDTRRPVEHLARPANEPAIHADWDPGSCPGRSLDEFLGPHHHNRLRVRSRERSWRVGDGELRTVQLRVQAAGRHQLVVGTSLDDATLVEDED